MKADITNAQIIVPPVEEATMLGAACTALLGAKLLKDVTELKSLSERRGVTRYIPDEARHQLYAARYRDVFEPIAEALRRLS